MSKTARNFSSKAAYNKWVAYGSMHGDFKASPGNTPVKINGKAHHVVHQASNHPHKPMGHFHK